MKTNLLNNMATHLVLWIKSLYVSIKSNLHEYGNTAAGGVIGFVSPSFYNTWIHPILLSALCALTSLLVTVLGKKILKRWGAHE